MVLFPNKVAIALGASLFIAYHGGKQTPLSGAAIAAHYGLKKRALEPVLQTLGHAGILGSIRGQGGGYYMQDPDKVSVRDVLSCFIDGLFSREEKAFAEGMPVLDAALRSGYNGWMERMSGITFADLCRNAENAGLPRLEDAVLDFAI